MYVQHEVNVSENQVNTLKDAIRLKKGTTLCFTKGGIRGDHILLLTTVQINRLDKAHVEGRRTQIRVEECKLHCGFSGTPLSRGGGGGGVRSQKGLRYFNPLQKSGMLASFAARALLMLTKRLVVVDMDSTQK